MRTPTLSTESLILCPLYHATSLQVEWLNEPKNVYFSEQRHKQHTLAKQQGYIRSFDHVNNHIWTIYLDLKRNGGHSNTAVGTITAYRDQLNKVGEMGILIDHNYSGKGYGTQAWDAVMNYLLQDMRKVEAGTRADNKGMRKVMELTGMHYEGSRMHHFLIDNDKTADMVMYGKMRSDM